MLLVQVEVLVAVDAFVGIYGIILFVIFVARTVRSCNRTPVVHRLLTCSNVRSDIATAFVGRVTEEHGHVLPESEDL